jgi:hypothetical protein
MSNPFFSSFVHEPLDFSFKQVLRDVDKIGKYVSYKFLKANNQQMSLFGHQYYILLILMEHSRISVKFDKTAWNVIGFRINGL